MTGSYGIVVVAEKTYRKSRFPVTRFYSGFSSPESARDAYQVLIRPYHKVLEARVVYEEFSLT